MNIRGDSGRVSGIVIASIAVAPALIVLALGAPVAGAAKRLDGAKRVPIAGLGGSLQNPCWSPNGRQLAITQWRGGYNETPAFVVRVPASGGAAVNNLSRPGDNAVNMPGTCWNPSSNRVAFTADPEGPDQVYTAAPDGSGRFQVTHLTAHQAFEPTFSPDGRWIVFERHKLDVEGQGEIWKVRANGTGLTRVTRGADDRQPNWAPVGNRIVFQRRQRGQWDVWTVRPDGSGLNNVTRTRNLEETDVSWSPSGRWLVFSGDASNVDVASLFTIRFDGAGRRQLTRTRGIYDGAPGWSPNGRRIAFESRPGDPDGSPGTKIWTIAAPPGRR